MRELLKKLGLVRDGRESDALAANRQEDTGDSTAGVKVAFLHINKTGGSTFRRILQSIFEQQFHYCEDPAIASVETALAKFACVEFHTLSYATNWALAHQELVSLRRWDLLEGRHNFTMLRDPVDQFLSLYYHLIKIRERVEPALKAQGLPFPDSIEMMLGHPACFNDQLAYLVGKRRDRESWVTRDDLELAKEMLLRLKMHVGLMEQFSDSMHVFEAVTGLKIPAATIVCENRNPNRPPLEMMPVDVLERIREGNALEYELYEFGRELLAQDLARFGLAPAYSVVDAAV